MSHVMTDVMTDFLAQNPRGGGGGGAVNRDDGIYTCAKSFLDYE